MQEDTYFHKNLAVLVTEQKFLRAFQKTLNTPTLLKFKFEFEFLTLNKATNV